MQRGLEEVEKKRCPRHLVFSSGTYGRAPGYKQSRRKMLGWCSRVAVLVAAASGASAFVAPGAVPFAGLARAPATKVCPPCRRFFSPHAGILPRASLTCGRACVLANMRFSGLQSAARGPMLALRTGSTSLKMANPNFVHRGQPAAREQHESRRDRVLVPRLRVALIRLRTGPQVCPLVRLRWRHRAHGGGVPLLPLCSLFFCAYARVLCDPCGPGEITEPAGKRRRMCMHAPHLSLLASPFPAYDSCTGLRTTEHLKPSI